MLLTCLAPLSAQDFTGAWSLLTNGFKGELYLQQEGSRIHGWLGHNGTNADNNVLTGTVQGTEINFTRTSLTLAQPQQWRGFISVSNNSAIEPYLRATGPDTMAGIGTHMGSWNFSWSATRTGAYREPPSPPPPPPSSSGTWRSVGTGDCPGSDVAGSSGPNPDGARCTAAFKGFTAVCWGRNCTYKNVPTASCTGGASPGRMYTCAAGGTASVPLQQQPPPLPPLPASGIWRSVGTGDCPGRDVAGSTGPNPDGAKCTATFKGFTAVCWNQNCTYKNIPTASCTGGGSPGRMYT